MPLNTEITHSKIKMNIAGSNNEDCHCLILNKENKASSNKNISSIFINADSPPKFSRGILKENDAEIITDVSRIFIKSFKVLPSAGFANLRKDNNLIK
jgi:hypothetical protein